MRRLTRRQAILTGSALALAPHARAQDAMDAELDTDVEAEIEASVGIEIDEIRRNRLDARALRIIPRDPAAADDPVARATYAEGEDYTAPAITDPQVRQALGARYWRIPEASRPSPAWAAANHQVDYRHLGSYAPPAAFELTHQVLSALAERNAFQFRDLRALRVFGLRGCQLADDGALSPWAATHRLKAVQPDHIHPRCLVGLWRPADRTIRLYRASTVPHVGNMFACLGAPKGWGTSLLPTGFYRYRAGVHKAATPARRQTGALLAEDRYVVLRTANDLSYDPFQPNDVWTYGAAHNVHAAGRNLRNPRFDSSGCQVIQGWYQDAQRLRADGPFDAFRRDAGLADAAGLPTAVEASGRGTYDYMLLTGHEAALAAQGGPAFAGYRVLRPGSRGDRVRAAQRALYARVPKVFGRTLPVDGYFSAAMSFAALIDKRLNGQEREYASPIIAG